MSQELSLVDVKEIRKFIIKQCANYDRSRKACVFASKVCISSDNPRFDDLCKYFRESALPTNRELAARLLS